MATATVNTQSDDTRNDELELASRAAAGDQQAFGQIYARYQGKVEGFLNSKLPQAADAEDLCQETFYQVSRCLGSFEGRSSLSSWILGIARHQLCRYYRKHQVQTTGLDDVAGMALDSGEVPADRRVELHRALESCEKVVEEEFTEAQRKVFHLRFHENRSTKAIASELGRSNQAVKISLFRSRRTLGERSRVAVEALSA